MTATHAPTFIPRRNASSGVALVLVLACLILLSVLILAFLSSVRTDLRSSKTYSDSNAVRMLADTAVKVVQSQIREATMETGHSWASQPGMIRTFDDAGSLVNAYKLYSSAEMKAPTIVPGTEAGKLNGWDAKPAVFTDLNERATDITGSRSIYPILTPPTLATAPEGYELDTTTAPTTKDQPVPMPASWIYVLRDGTLAPPSGGGKSASVPGATKLNPIVGRIAFWTDDETCKVNVNTAGEGTPWDMPRYGWVKEYGKLNPIEEALGKNSPVNGEYQRYPGHPAGVSLSTVFPQLATNIGAKPNDLIFSLSPRIVKGGSDGGKTPTISVDANGYVIPASAMKPLTEVPGLDSDRLYATVDEYLFAMKMNGQNRESQPASPAPFTQDTLEEARFFLTTHSRAPELNLFGLPRVSIWPVHATLAGNPSSPYTTAYDRLAAFCSTYGGSNKYHYYFQRENADDPKHDYDAIPRNQELYSYLKALTSQNIPGALAPFTGSFASKFATDNDQIITEIFDYVRSTNLCDDNLGGGVNSSATYPQSATAPASFKQFTDPRAKYEGNTISWAGHGQVAPIQIGDTMGFGRFYTISQIGLQVICTAEGGSGALEYQDPVGGVSPVVGSSESPQYVSNLPVAQKLRDKSGQVIGWNAGTRKIVPNGGGDFPVNPTLTTTGIYAGPLQALGPGEKKLQAMLLLAIQTPSVGWESLNGDFEIEIEGLSQIQIGGATPFPSGTLVLKSPQFSPATGNDIVWNQWPGGDKGMRYLLCSFPVSNDKAVNQRVNGWGFNVPIPIGFPARPNPANKRSYPFVSNPFLFPASSPNITLGGGAFTIRTYVCSKGVRVSGTPIQTFNSVSFPRVTVPAPDLLRYGVLMDTGNNLSYFPPWGGSLGPPNKPSYTSPAIEWWGFDNRINWAGAGPIPFNPTGKVSEPGQKAGAVIRSDPAYDPKNPPTWNLQLSGEKWPKAPPAASTPDNTVVSDVVRSIMVRFGDTRLVACQSVIDAAKYFAKPGAGYDSPIKKAFHYFALYNGAHMIFGNPSYGTNTTPNSGKLVPPPANLSVDYTPNVPGNVSASVSKASGTGDFDSSLPGSIDGSFINKPDEGNSATYNAAGRQGNVGSGASFSTPNRILPSPGMFGSLPTHVKRAKPWTTLLFRPDPPSATHPDTKAGEPKDHLVMDLLNMPIVEPYAISEPFSSAGKINMNYQILPYTYVTRSTAVRAALKSILVTAVPTSAGRDYKDGANVSFRYTANREENGGTLRQFRERFDAGDIFRSATEICDVFLVPGKKIDNSGSPQNWTSNFQALSFWNANQLTGENVRERPYADLYARLTTKSNTYQVHYRVQSLQKRTNSDPATWEEGKDAITGEMRGSTIIERYLDPTDATIPDAATDPQLAPGAGSLEKYYKFRTVNSTTFHP